MKVSTDLRKSESPPSRISDSPEIGDVKPAVDESHPSSKISSIIKEEAIFEEEWIQTRKANVRVYPEDSAGIPIVDSPHLVSSFSHDEFESTYESTKSLFEKVYQYVKPSPFFRFVVYLYAERKLLVFFWIHFVCTMIIWGQYHEIECFSQSKITDFAHIIAFASLPQLILHSSSSMNKRPMFQKALRITGGSESFLLLNSVRCMLFCSKWP